MKAKIFKECLGLISKLVLCSLHDLVNCKTALSRAIRSCEFSPDPVSTQLLNVDLLA